MPSAAERLVALIDEAGGALRFDRFVHECLYGVDGFYTSGRGRAGRRGDFITSPEVGPLFGAVVARALDAWWDELGRPEDFRVVEVGAGPGTLARAILAARPACLEGRANAYVAVEIADEQRLAHPDGITSVANTPHGAITGVVLANELLDNVEFRLLVSDGAWREAWVTHRDGQFLEILRPLEPGLERVGDVDLGELAPLGARIALQEVAATWVRDIVSRLRGRLVVVDYMVPRTSDLVLRPWRDWLRTFADQGKGSHHLRSVGHQDVTCDVCIDQLIGVAGEPLAVRSQSQFLQLWGIEDLVEEGKRIWSQRAASPDLEAMRMRSRISESEALLDPDGLGGFTVIEFQGSLAGTDNYS